MRIMWSLMCLWICTWCAPPAQARVQLPGYSFATDTLRRDVPGIEATESIPRVGGVAWGPALRVELDRRAQATLGDFVEAYADPDLLDPDAPIFMDGEWRLEWATSCLVALRHQGVVFTGGAHPNHDCELLTLVWEDDALRETPLDSLLIWSPSLEAVLRRQTSGHLRLLGSKEAKSRGWKGLSATRLKQALPTEAGLLYVLDAYEVGGYADGSYEFVVPWRALDDHLKAGGALARSLER